MSVVKIFDKLHPKQATLLAKRLITKNDNIFVSDKIMIIPSYLSKGLEFDAVIVSNASSNNYTEKEKNLFYVVLTRALHKLEIYHTDELTNLITGDTNEK